MKQRTLSFSLLAAVAVLTLPRLSIPTAAAPPPPAGPAKPSTNAAPAQLEIPKSIYIVPTRAKEGRDPFFPNSTREYTTADGKSARSAKTAATADALLDLKGFSARPGFRLAIINDHSFGVGEEGEVNTPAGRIRIRCVAIKDDSVVVEIGGERRELQFRLKK